MKILQYNINTDNNQVYCISCLTNKIHSPSKLVRELFTVLIHLFQDNFSTSQNRRIFKDNLLKARPLFSILIQNHLHICSMPFMYNLLSEKISAIRQKTHQLQVFVFFFDQQQLFLSVVMEQPINKSYLDQIFCYNSFLYNMNKITRKEYDIQEELMDALFKLIAKRSSSLFDQPVDAQEYPDYYQVITEPMNLQTIVIKLKNLEYKFANEVLQDLQLIVKNCIFYNNGNERILKKVKKFEECVKTTWANFLKQISQKNISVNKPFTHSPQMLERLINLQEKRKYKKYDHFENICEKTTESNLQHSSIIQPIQVQNKFQQFFQYLHGVSQNDDVVLKEDKMSKCSVNIDSTSIKQAFYTKSVHKLQKYKKLLFKKLLWINQKIIGKSLRIKRFQKLQAPKMLYEYFDKGEIIQTANTHKIQLYLKLTLFWIQQYQEILNGYLKDKLINNCQYALRCLRKIIRYKEWQIGRDIDYFIYDVDKDSPSQQQEYEQQNYLDQPFNKVTRQFQKMMLRDRQISYKKDTKITIKNADCGLIIIDNPCKLLSKNNRKRSGLQYKYEITLFDENRQKTELEKQQKKLDKQFIEQYTNKNNLEIINKFDGKFSLDWDEIIGQKMKDVIKLDFMQVEDFESWKESFVNEQQILEVWQQE